MTREQILQRLDDTITRMKELDESEFFYTHFVKETNKEKCPTICCIAGWYPKWFPEAELRWIPSGERPDMTLDVSYGKNSCADRYSYINVMYQLCNWHGLHLSLVDCLFMGRKLYYGKDYSLEIRASKGMHSSLPEVLLVWETVRDLVAKGELDFYLKL
jgi:hypothetical protein